MGTLGRHVASAGALVANGGWAAVCGNVAKVDTFDTEGEWRVIAQIGTVALLASTVLCRGLTILRLVAGLQRGRKEKRRI